MKCSIISHKNVLGLLEKNQFELLKLDAKFVPEKTAVQINYTYYSYVSSEDASVIYKPLQKNNFTELKNIVLEAILIKKRCTLA